MSDLMPKEQAEFIDELQRWFHESTNMCHEDCYRFAFVIWQHSDKLSQMLGCHKGKEIAKNERKQVLEEVLNLTKSSIFASEIVTNIRNYSIKHLKELEE